MLKDVQTTVEASSTLNLRPNTVKRSCKIGKLQDYEINNGWITPQTEVGPFAGTYNEPTGRPAKGRENLDGKWSMSGLKDPPLGGLPDFPTFSDNSPGDSTLAAGFRFCDDGTRTNRMRRCSVKPGHI